MTSDGGCPVDHGLLDADFPSYEVTRNLYPHYATWRSEAPVHRAPGRDEFIVTRHVDVIEALRRPDDFSSMSTITEDGVMRARRLDEVGQGRVTQLVMSDPPEHTRWRKLAATPFRRQRLESYEPMVRTVVDQLIDGFIDRGEVDFVPAFSSPLPATVMMNLLGLPLDDLHRAIEWSWYDGQGTRFCAPEHQRAIQPRLQDVAAYVRDAVHQRHEQPRDDWLSEFVQSHTEPDGTFDEANVAADTSNLIFGGMLTTNHLLGNILYLLCTHPEAMQQLLDDPSKIMRCVEETLRIDSPVQWVPRIAVHDTELGGVAIPAGSILLMVLGSANHDDAVFDEPEQFRLDRANIKDHVAFGHHIHLCIGAPLARLESKVALEQLLSRLRDIRLADPESVEYHPRTMMFRGFEHLHLAFERT